MIKNIVFDIGNVLLNFLPEKYLVEKYTDEKIVEKLYTEIFKSKEWIDLDRGTLTKQEAVERIINRNPEYAESIQRCMEEWHDILTPIDESVALLKLISEKNYKSYMLSNFHLVAFEHVYEKFDFFKLFDGGIISYREKLVKPELDIYKRLVEEYSIRPEESLFIDDMEVNIRGAEKLGFHVVLFKNSEQLKTSLYELSIL